MVVDYVGDPNRTLLARLSIKSWDCLIMWIGPFKVFAEYAKR